MGAFGEGAGEEEHHARRPRKPKRTNGDSPTRRDTGRQGGPPNNRGVEYQDGYNRLLILRMMQESLHDPLSPPSVNAAEELWRSEGALQLSPEWREAGGEVT